MFWYQNMVRYARKHFSSFKVGVLRLTICTGMILRILVTLFAGGPRDLPNGEAVRCYANIALWAIGLGGRSVTESGG
jgi:hypothetical protein